MRIILSRALGSQMLGIYQVALSFFGVLCTIVSSGIPVAISHVSAKCGVSKDYKKEGSYISSGLIIGLILSVILTILLIAFKNLIIKSTNDISYNILLILIPAMFATAVYSCFRGALWGREKHTANCLAEVGEQGIRLILFIILLTDTPNQVHASYLAGLALCISCFVSMLISIIFYKKYGGKLASPKTEYKNLLKTSMTITITRVATSLVQPIIAVILPLRLVSAGYSSEIAMSLFGVALGMTFPLLALPNTICGSFATALVPKISSLIEKKDYKEFNEKIKLAISVTLFACFCFVPLFIGLGQEIGLLLFDNTTCGYLLTISAWTMIPSCLCMITNSILNTLNMEKQGFVTYLIGAICLFVCVWFLPKYCGVSSVILGMGGCNAITTILNCYLIAKKTKVKKLIAKPLLLMTIFSIPSALLGNYTFNVIKYFMPSLFSVAISAFVCCASFVLLCIIFNLINIKDLFKDLNVTKALTFRKKRKQKCE